MDSSRLRCQSCDTENRDQARFCTRCGGALATNDRIYLGVYGIAALVACLVFLAVRSQFTTEPSVAEEVEVTQPSHATMPDHEVKHLAQLKTEAATGKPESMLAYAEHLIELSHQHPELLHEAIAPLSSLSQQFPAHALTLRTLGNVLFDANLPDQAIKVYEEYLRLQPEDVNVLTDLGTQYFYADRTQDALVTYTEAVSKFPNHYHAHFNLYLVYTRLKDEGKAQEHLQKAAQIEEAYGKIMGPVVELKRSFDGSPRPTTTPAYQELESYFRQHPILGPKFTSLEVSGDQITVYMHDFPIEAMPPFARESFDQKIKDQLEKLPTNHSLELRDQHSRSILASY